MRRMVAFVVYPGFQLLDAAGPMAVFHGAEQHRPGSYALQLRSPAAGSIASSCGATLNARSLGRLEAKDTLLVTGSSEPAEAMACPKLRRFLLRSRRQGTRMTSVCTGSFVLAAAGLLDGKVATTHWAHAQSFERQFPLVRLQPDSIFVRDGNTWCSAGVTAGIDLALALVTEDLGEAIARRVAQQLVVYYQRPGGQSQFSSLLAGSRFGGRFEALLDHIRTHLRDPLTVVDLAAKSGMSPRNFSRCFTKETGASPARTVERVRAECARALLRDPSCSVAEVAASCGFGSGERMRRALLRLYGLGPTALRAP